VKHQRTISDMQVTLDRLNGKVGLDCETPNKGNNIPTRGNAKMSTKVSERKNTQK